MAEIGGFYKPEISLFATTTDGDRKLLYDRLYLDSSGLGNVLDLNFTENPRLKTGTRLKCLFSWMAGRTDEFLLCAVDSVYPVTGRGYRVRAYPPYHPFLRKRIGAASWRGSTLIELLQDILEIVDVDSYDLSAVRDMDIPRFTVPISTARGAIDSLISMAGEATGRKAIMLPSPQGAFLCGFPEDVRITIGNTSDIIAFEKGVNIIAREKSHITAFALPVLFNQEVGVDGVRHLCTRSLISARPGLYRLGMEVQRL